MMPEPKNPPRPPEPSRPEDVDFADEAGPKDTEFKKRADAKQITAGEFDPIP
jgi:hypothetical protein